MLGAFITSGAATDPLPFFSAVVVGGDVKVHWAGGDSVEGFLLAFFRGARTRNLLVASPPLDLIETPCDTEAYLRWSPPGVSCTLTLRRMAPLDGDHVRSLRRHLSIHHEPGLTS